MEFYMIASANGDFDNWSVFNAPDHYQAVDEIFGHEDDDSTYVYTTYTTSPGKVETFYHSAPKLPSNIYISNLEPYAKLKLGANSLKATLKFKLGVRISKTNYLSFLWSVISKQEAWFYASGQKYSSNPNNNEKWRVREIEQNVMFIIQAYIENGDGRVKGYMTACWLKINFQYAQAYINRRR